MIKRWTTEDFHLSPSRQPLGDRCCTLVEKNEAEVFDGIRDNEEFIKIKEKLSEYAGDWKIQ